MTTSGLTCSMWDLAPWPGIEPLPPALGGWGLSHWTPREVPVVPSVCSALYRLQLSNFKSSLMSQLKTHFPQEAFPGSLLKLARCSCCVFWGNMLSFPWPASPLAASLSVCCLSLLPHCSISEDSDCFNSDSTPSRVSQIAWVLADAYEMAMNDCAWCQNHRSGLNSRARPGGHENVLAPWCQGKPRKAGSARLGLGLKG